MTTHIQKTSPTLMWETHLTKLVEADAHHLEHGAKFIGVKEGSRFGSAHKTVRCRAPKRLYTAS